MDNAIIILRSIGAVVIGYATIVIGALIFQDALFDRVTHDSSLVAIVVGGGMTAVASVLGGYLLAQVAPARPFWHAIPLMAWLCIESTLLHLEGNSPLWFDIMAGGSNVLGVLIGTLIWLRVHQTSEPAANL